MKRIILFLLITINSVWAAPAPFKRGVNLTEWFQSPCVGQIQFTRFTKQDLINIKNLGCDAIRLPINLHSMTSGEPDYTIDPLLFYLLDQVVDWAEELQLHLILDNHSFDPAVDTDPNIVDILVPVWTQMAQHYQYRSNLIYYEILNEPHGISDEDWNSIQQTVIDAIRAVDQIHTIIVGPAGWNSYNNLDEMPWYTDDNLIYTFHFYDPFLFTHQGASWTDPSLESLAGMPFPYNPDSMPELPSEIKYGWVWSSYKSYDSDGSVWNILDLIEIVDDFQKERNVRIFCGEFGAYQTNTEDIHRIFWYFIVRMFLEYHEISWTTWSYKGGFGLFEEGTYELFNYDLNVPLVKLLGFYPPAQGEYYLTPDLVGFDIYLDYIDPNIYESSWIDEGLLDYYSEDSPADGNFCIHFADVNQYDKISLQFSPIKDLSILAADGYAIDFYVRCDDPSAEFDIRFVDTKTDASDDHPWRMRYTIDDNVAVWKGGWNHLQIPLTDFTEHGAYDNGWYEPIGDFDWAAVEKFEIASEHGDLIGTHLYFDNIRIVNPSP